ncbi:hypothetical protein KEM60_01976 [Austwickia sp. TVS 96-490-7B]|uniref:type VII secretion-associated serine protease mycosin n=1 Tax=Austwickia sp. TVS 96-490-7B TaxID=2830843 RepID=UPI001C58661A|nr:type VII secretion-associated serine protease mycosin [Austwickia sp. TVS 96-490-7B]MBW3085767.1 hypothetical protein [Austwickia sp. TVS 96-490-7B]
MVPRHRPTVLLSATALTALSGIGLTGPLADPLSAPAARAEGVYQQSSACISDLPAPTTVSAGVSWAQQQLRYSELWPLATGKGVTVAVIDSGVTPGSAFGDRLIGGGDLIIPAEKGLRDCDGHGTLVAGIIAGATDSATGFSGVAPGATILSIRQASQAYRPASGNGPPGAGTPQSLAAAVDSAVAQGAKVINISEAECGNAGTVDDPRLTAAVTAALDRNVVVVASAGNLGGEGACRDQNTPGKPAVTGATPADIPGVIAVGAVDQQGSPAPFSLAGPWVGMAAPGVEIISTNPYPGRGGQVSTLVTTRGVQKIQGTSFSAPYVAGVAALVRERYPQLTARQVAARILETAAGQRGPGGRNDFTGHGLLDPRAALTAVRPQEQGDAPAPRPAPTAMERMPRQASVATGTVPALVATGIITAGLVVTRIVMSVRRRRS